MKLTLKLLGLGLLGTAMVWAGTQRSELVAFDLETWVASFGWAGPLVFVLVYVLATILFLPGSLLTLAGGALFGLGLGTLFNLAGATIGAGISFLLARGLLAEWVESKTKGKLAQLKEGVEKEDWQFVAFVRMVPLFPFNLLNYALGLTRIGFWRYLVTSSITMLPGALVYTYIGFLGKQAVSGGDGWAETSPKALLALGAFAVVAYLSKLYFSRKKSPTFMISVEQLHRRLVKGELLLLDLRDAEDFQTKGNITGAKNIPLPMLPDLVGQIADWKEKPVTLICTTAIRSQKARLFLLEKGFKDLSVVDGGMKAWNATGIATEGRSSESAEG